MAFTDLADPRETTGGHQPPETAEDHPWWLLGLKFALAMFTVAWVCSMFGMSNPSTGIIAAGFLVSSPPVDALRVTAYRIVGMFVGAALGTAGAYWGASQGNAVPPIFFAGFGAVVGTMASRHSALTYAGVIGAIVATTGALADTSIPTVALETGAQLVIGCAVGLGVIWIIEQARALWKARTA